MYLKIGPKWNIMRLLHSLKHLQEVTPPKDPNGTYELQSRPQNKELFGLTYLSLSTYIRFERLFWITYENNMTLFKNYFYLIFLSSSIFILS